MELVHQATYVAEAAAHQLLKVLEDLLDLAEVLQVAMEIMMVIMQQILLAVAVAVLEMEELQKLEAKVALDL